MPRIRYITKFYGETRESFVKTAADFTAQTTGQGGSVEKVFVEPAGLGEITGCIVWSVYQPIAE